MFDLKELSAWDTAEHALTLPKAPLVSGVIRTFQRMIERDDQVQCPFGFTKEVLDGQD